MSTTHPQSAEVARLLAHLIASGFSLASLDDGGDERADVGSPAEFADAICGVDESRLYVTHPLIFRVNSSAPRPLCLFIVLGNGAGELVCDYSSAEALDSCLVAFQKSEEERAAGPFDLFTQPADHSTPAIKRQTVTGECSARKIIEARNRAELALSTFPSRTEWSYAPATA